MTQSTDQNNINDGATLKPVETWKFKISRGDDVKLEFERTFGHDHLLGSPFTQADLLARGLQNKYPKYNVNATCTTSNSFIAMQSFEDLIKSEMFYHDNRQRPIDLSGIDQTNVNTHLQRALNARHGESDETVSKAKEITSKIIHRERGEDEPTEGKFEVDVDGFTYRFVWERYDDSSTNFLSGGEPNVWFDIQAELYPLECPDCGCKLRDDGANEPINKEWFKCECCEERWVRTIGAGEELDQAV